MIKRTPFDIKPPRVEVIKARLRVLDAIARKHGLRFNPGGATKLTAGGLVRWEAASAGGSRRRT
jgi:hypothetical protein